ncbi:FadR/GntR family transcriptional regulator [Nocardioides sp.]|uniref:FadR/GntR family transcriptional regulator n=1 Tax=Nocardioides sp. TaxID=35761 RepID=UPI0035150859
MPLAPVTRASVSDAVFAALTEEILSGRLAPGEPLPAERDLATTFEVNRHAVREALKRLQQAGLVVISQGGRTRVQDWRAHAGLEALVGLVHSGAVPSGQVLDDLLEMRAALGADAARWCAQRASADEVATVIAAAQAYPERPGPDLTAIDLVFWTAVVDGAHNLAYRLGLNTLASGIAAVGHEHLDGLLEEYADRAAHLALAHAIADRDADRALALAQALLARR